MAQIRTIKKDEFGLYVVAGGWIARPFFGTMFKEGDEVKTHHFGGSTSCGVTFNEKILNFKKFDNEKPAYEVWGTSGVANWEYETISKKELKRLFTWYKTHVTSNNPFGKEYNEKFKKLYDSR